MTTKLASDLVPGDVIPPPTHERGWLWRDGTRRMMTVVSLADGHPDRRGPWLVVRVSYPSPYADKTSETVLRLRPGTALSCQDAAQPAT